MKSERLIIQKKRCNGLEMSREGLQQKGLEKTWTHSEEAWGLDFERWKAGL